MTGIGYTDIYAKYSYILSTYYMLLFNYMQVLIYDIFKLFVYT